VYLYKKKDMASTYTYAKDQELTKVGVAVTIGGRGASIETFYLGAVKSDSTGMIRHIFAMHPSMKGTSNAEECMMNFEMMIDCNESKVNVYLCAEKVYPAIFGVIERLDVPIYAPDNGSVKTRTFNGVLYKDFVCSFKQLEAILLTLEKEVRDGI